jgi:hypothetical protein
VRSRRGIGLPLTAALISGKFDKKPSRGVSPLATAVRCVISLRRSCRHSLRRSPQLGTRASCSP